MELSTHPARPSPEERCLCGVELCRRLAATINKIAVAHMGLWDQTWEIVSEADAEFMVALFAWERAGTRKDSDHVAETYDAVMGAWRRAADAFQEHQRAGSGS